MGFKRTKYELYVPAIEIVRVVPKRVVQFNGHRFETHKAISHQKDHEAVRQITAGVRQHDKWDRKDVQEHERTSHLNERKGYRLFIINNRRKSKNRVKPNDVCERKQQHQCMA